MIFEHTENVYFSKKIEEEIKNNKMIEKLSQEANGLPRFGHLSADNMFGIGYEAVKPEDIPNFLDESGLLKKRKARMGKNNSVKKIDEEQILKRFEYTVQEYIRFYDFYKNQEVSEENTEAFYVMLQTKLMILRKYDYNREDVYLSNVFDAIDKMYPEVGENINILREKFEKLNNYYMEVILSDGTSLNLYKAIEDVLYGLYLHADPDKIERLLKTNKNVYLISKTDYELYDVYRSVFSKGLVMELITKTVLFIGFGFADPNLDRFISIVRHTFEKYSPPTHYCFMRSVSYEDYLDEKGNLTRQKKIEFEQDKKLQDLKIRSMKGYGIHTILVDDFTQITAMLKYIRDKYTLNKVFISGALDPNDSHNYGCHFDEPYNINFKNGEWFIMQLSKRIIDDGYDIVNGFGVGIGNYVVSGAYMGGVQRGGSDYVSKHLTIQPLISVEQQESDKKDEVRRKLIRDCGTVIFLFGKTLYEDNNSKKDELDNDGTYREYEIAVKEVKNVIPVGATGLTSRYIYNEVYSENQNTPFIDRLNAVDENINCMQLIDDIMAMIESEKRKKEENIKQTLMKDAFSNDDMSHDNLPDQINVFVSFHFAGANQQSRLILSVLDDEPGINPVKESGKISDESKIEQWIDKKIKSTSVTILILSKGMTKSIWVGREIQKSIEENNKFVLIDISSGQYDKDFLSQYKIGSKSLDEIYPIHSVENCNEKEGFADVGKWVRDAVADI